MKLCRQNYSEVIVSLSVLALFKLLITLADVLSSRNCNNSSAYLEYKIQIDSVVIEQTQMCLSLYLQQGLASCSDWQAYLKSSDQTLVKALDFESDQTLDRQINTY